MSHASALLWMAHVLAFHLNVPEPVHFELKPALPGFEAQHDAVMDFNGRNWIVRYDPERFRRSDSKQIRLVIAHELCHGVYNHTPSFWQGLDEKRKNAEHKRVKDCAANVLWHHKMKVNHGR